MSDLSVFAITDASSIVVKATVLLATAIVIQYLLRRRASAATRDVVLTLAAISVLVLPVASLVSPEWGLLRRQADLGQSEEFRPEADAAVAGSAVAGQNIVPASLPSSSGISDLSRAPWLPLPGGAYARALALVYAAGAGAILLHLLLQRLKTRRFLRSTTVVEDPEWQELLASCVSSIGIKASVRLLRSREQNVPLAVGTRRPAIVIPAIADTWEHDRRQAVLLHELAHVARHDCLTGVIVVVSCAMYWFHPAMWWVARQLRIERELACDDRVIAAGAGGRDYAGHLLEIAYSTGGRGSFAFAVAMARRSQLEGRLLAAIDETRNRRVPALRVRLAAVAIGAAMLVAIAGARTTVVGQSNQVSAQASVEVKAPEDSRKQVVSVDPVRERLSLVSSRVASRLVRAVADVARNLQDNLPGTWEIRPTDTQGVVHLRLVEVNSQSGTNVQVAQLEGLTPAHLSGAGGPVQFRIRRDPGTFTFEGVFRGGVGAGTFSFAPDANFPAEMAKRGFSRPTASEQYQLARHDIGFAFVDELTRQGYGKPQTSELVQAGQHGVHLTYLRDMGALGYRLGTLQPLITLRDHGVTPEYVRQLAELGYKNLSADQVRNARDHGVTAEYVRGMRDAGYGSQTLDALINSRDHGVTPEYIRALDEAGYRKVPLEDVIRVRDHGVSPEYIRDMHQLGFKLPIDELVRARDHGVSVEYVRGIVALGYGNQPIDALIRLRDHGVTPEYAKEIKGLGYDGLTLDDLISLRDHGVTVERIKSANARAGTRLPIDMLRSLAAGGMR